MISASGPAADDIIYRILLGPRYPVLLLHDILYFVWLEAVRDATHGDALLRAVSCREGILNLVADGAFVEEAVCVATEAEAEERYEGYRAAFEDALRESAALLVLFVAGRAYWRSPSLAVVAQWELREEWRISETSRCPAKGQYDPACGGQLIASIQYIIKVRTLSDRVEITRHSSVWCQRS
jgi:hypothetical protein